MGTWQHWVPIDERQIDLTKALFTPGINTGDPIISGQL